MRRELILACTAGVLLAALDPFAPARAGDTEPVIVIPGRPGVPVMLYGRDVSGAVLEGDWGLARPGVVAPTVIQEGWGESFYHPSTPYFPMTGHRPRYGRLEVIPPPNRPQPRPAQPYRRVWGTHSDAAPATVPQFYDVPPVAIAPRHGHRRPGGPHPKQ